MLSGAALLKRNASGAWHGIHTIDQGNTSNYVYLDEFNPSNQLIGGTTGASWTSTGTFTDTTNFGIYGFTWGGANTAGSLVWRWKVGAGAWSNESETMTFDVGGVTSAGSGFRHVIGNEAALGDDANFDIVCAGLIKSNLSQATFESLDMSSFSTWQAVFTGAGAALWGYETISTQTDRTGNGSDELSRSAGITLVSDPAGWSWGAVTETPPPNLTMAPYQGAY